MENGGGGGGLCVRLHVSLVCLVFVQREWLARPGAANGHFWTRSLSAVKQ